MRENLMAIEYFVKDDPLLLVGNLLLEDETLKETPENLK
jgi:hypothetical protein